MDTPALDSVFAAQPRMFDAVIHFAALKAVGAGLKLPLKCYGDDLSGPLNLQTAMRKYECKTTGGFEARHACVRVRAWACVGRA